MNLAAPYRRPHSMHIPLLAALALLLALTMVLSDRLSSADIVKPDAAVPAWASQTYGNLPLSFEANQGQTAAQVDFLSRGSGYTLFLTPGEAVLTLPVSAPVTREDGAENVQGIPPSVLRMQLVSTNPQPLVTGLGELPGKSNYFTGNDSSKWRTNVPSYASVKYQAVYPGIDLIYYGNQRQLEYDFVLAPGADPGEIRLTFEGADEITLDAQGNLVLHMESGEVILNAPVIYQEIDGTRQPISGGYALQGENHVAFNVGIYDTSRTLVIDPVLDYSTYLGGGDDEEGKGIAVDLAGNVYVTGETFSSNFPTASPIDGSFGGGFVDAFVTKIDSTGASLVYSTYLGGNGSDHGYDIALDSDGHAYITGDTRSTNFPTASPIQASLNGTQDAFVTKLNAAGTALVYSTYLGGDGVDTAWGIALGTDGTAYIAGQSFSSDFPTVNPFQGSNAGNKDAFVTKVNASGTALTYSTYLGGLGQDQGYSIAVDASGNAYVSGVTYSANFPTNSAFQDTFGGGDYDAFVTKINALGDSLVYSTYLGGSSQDQGNGIAVDADGNAYVTGFTWSDSFPTATPIQGTNAGGPWEAFVTKLNAQGTGLVYSTYLGGVNNERGQAIAVDVAGNAYVTGDTNSDNFPTASAIQDTRGGVQDAFVVKIGEVAPTPTPTPTPIPGVSVPGLWILAGLFLTASVLVWRRRQSALGSTSSP